MPKLLTDRNIDAVWSELESQFPCFIPDQQILNRTDYWDYKADALLHRELAQMNDNYWATKATFLLLVLAAEGELE